MSEQSSFFKDIKENILDYINAKLKLYKVEASEKVAKVMALLYSSIIIALFGFLLLFFISLGVGFFLSELLDSSIAGFAIVSGIYLVVLLIVVSKKQTIEKQRDSVFIRGFCRRTVVGIK